MLAVGERRSIHIDGLSHLTAIPVASRIGPLLMSSVIAPFDPGTRDVPDTVDEQVRNVFTHVGSMLDAAGATVGRRHQDELLGRPALTTGRPSRRHGSNTSPTKLPVQPRHTQVSTDTRVVTADFTAYVT